MKAMLFLLSMALFLIRLDNPLLEPEEARYAEIPRQMLAAERWLIPALHGEDYLHKPPLFYWLVMGVYKIVGVHDWAARLVPAAAGIATVLVTYFWSRSWLAAVVLLLSPRFLYQARMVGLDGLLALWVAVGWWAAQRAWEQKFSWWWWIFASIATGFGILTKGPVALVLVGTPIFCWRIYNACGFATETLGEKPSNRRNDTVAKPQAMVRPAVWMARFGVYLAISLAVAAPWFVAIAIEKPDAFADFFWVHHVLRFADPLDHQKPWWFYLPYLLIGSMPWTFGLIGFRPRRGPYFALCAGIGLLFFSAAGCKRPGYLLPLWAPWSVLLAMGLERGLNWSPTTWRRVACSGGATLGAFLWFWSPSYHARFGIRDRLPTEMWRTDCDIACIGKRWDSISFYTGRSDVMWIRDETWMPIRPTWIVERSAPVTFRLVSRDALAERGP